MNRQKSHIAWKSKIVDLIIVVIGITIAFQLNQWKESNQISSKAKEYLTNFSEENRANESRLENAVAFINANEKYIDTLKHLLVSAKYEDERIKSFAQKMMIVVYFYPTTTTMQNIKASGEFGLIKNAAIRKKVIETYTEYEVLLKINEKLAGYLENFAVPFFFEKAKFKNFHAIKESFVDTPQFENIVFGYSELLSQQITAYKRTLEKVENLDKFLKIDSI